MNKVYQKEVLDLFSDRLRQNFKSHCVNCHMPDDLAHFVTYLIDRDLINSSIIRKYAIKEAYYDLHEKEEIGKTQVVQVLSKRFNVSKRTVWSVLQEDSQ